MAMGEQLVQDMSGPWKPANFTDSFKEQILELVKEKVESGDTETISDADDEPQTAGGGAKILDLTEMLRRSLGKDKRGTSTARKSAPVRPKKPAPATPQPKEKATKNTAESSAG